MTATSQSPTSADAPERRGFGSAFLPLCVIELFERLAFFGIRVVVPLYIMQADEPGGLHMTAVHKGWVYMWWAILQSWLPMFTGGIADRYGYKRVLFGAISANAVGYLMMALLHSYYGFFTGILVLATGTAFFKPALQGSIAQNLTKARSSLGWGIFYWVVNIGGFLAPILVTIILGKPHTAEGWRNLFLASSAYTALNLLILFTFKDVPSGADKTHSLAKVFAVTIENIWPYWFRGGVLNPVRGPLGVLIAAVGVGIIIFWSDQWAAGTVLFLGGGCLATWLDGGRFEWQLRLPAFLAIMSCFWMMMYQLWDLHPNFIEDWIDSSMVVAYVSTFAAYVPFEGWWEYGDRGLVQVPQQLLLNLNAFLIILLVLPISWLVAKMRTLSAMLIGMSVATVGIVVAGLTGNGWVFLLGVVFFSLGEMLTGPKKNEYLGLIAPPGKKGLYLGYVNIPVGVGVGIGSMIAGVVYDNYGEKATLALKELASNPPLVARAVRSVDWSDSLEKLPPLLKIDREVAFDRARQNMGVDAETAAASLRGVFRFDKGQIENLLLQFILQDDRFEGGDKARQAFADAVKDAIDKDAGAASRPATTAPTSMPDASHVARYVHLAPKALDRSRSDAFGIVRDLVNRDRPVEEHADDSEILDMLWRRFGNDPDVLNNLALEYLAQATALLSSGAEAVVTSGGDDLESRIKQVSSRLGIGRTKSFAALSAARGADDNEVDAALSDLDATPSPRKRAFVYLIGRPHVRFLAVARKDWSRDQALLRHLIRSDEKAAGVVRDGIDVETWSESALNAFKRLFAGPPPAGAPTEEGIDYTRLAEKPELIQKALAAKDWSASAEHAARLLGLNDHEARALVGAEIGGARLATTHLLWDKYLPQYKVWLPFAAIGVLAAIALAIFGRMARRWADMNV